MIIHGYNGIPKVHEWLEETLKKQGYKVTMPQFPTQESVRYKVWYDILEPYKNEFNKETIIVAHSIGNPFILKYITKNKLNIGLYISLAGFCDSFQVEGKEDLNKALKDFEVTKEEIEQFRQYMKSSYSIYSDTDHIVPLEVLENYPRHIGAEPVFIKGIGHMGKKSKVESIPEILSIIKNYEQV